MVTTDQTAVGHRAYPRTRTGLRMLRTVGARLLPSTLVERARGTHAGYVCHQRLYQIDEATSGGDSVGGEPQPGAGTAGARGSQRRPDYLERVVMLLHRRQHAGVQIDVGTCTRQRRYASPPPSQARAPPTYRRTAQHCPSVAATWLARRQIDNVCRVRRRGLWMERQQSRKQHRNPDYGQPVRRGACRDAVLPCRTVAEPVRGGGGAAESRRGGERGPTCPGC
jgi:hypothetical protein